MEHLKDLFKSRMKELNIKTMAELGRRANVKDYIIKDWFSGKSSSINAESFLRLQKVLGLNELPDTAPYLGVIGAGDFVCPESDMFHDLSDDLMRVEIPMRSQNGVVFKIRGDSMNQEIPNGYLILVEPITEDAASYDKKIVLICDDKNELTCKQYDHTTRDAVPLSDNPEHKTFSLKNPDLQIKGVVRCAFKNWGG
jgi:SOS-response transcriptional repressor LexA